MFIKKSLFRPAKRKKARAFIESRAKANFVAAISNIILGKASIDTFDSAVEAAEKAGYDELTKIYQDAYNRYLENLK